MSQKMKKQLIQLAKVCEGDFCYDLTSDAFNLIIRALMKSENLSERDKAILVKQFSKKLISVDCIINTIL